MNTENSISKGGRDMEKDRFNEQPREDTVDMENGKDKFNEQLGEAHGSEAHTAWEFYIAGVQHHKLHTCIGELKEGQCLSLIPEPTNRYDPCAVQICYPTQDSVVMLGYVPQRISPQVNAAVVDGNSTISCKILEINPEEKPWKQCKVVIKVEKK